MMDRPSDSGYELVLDNRRLIVAFGVLILLFGCFFVLGFVEGKRQGFQAGSQSAAEMVSGPTPAIESPASETPASMADSAIEASKEQSDERPLDWYKSVSGKGEQPAITPPPAVSNPVLRESTEKPSATLTSRPAAKSAAKPAASIPASYSVQVGAFRQKKQVDAKADVLRAKGFDCRIEPPQSDEGLYLLKVGKYKSRAEAVAVQLRLKKSGFSSFIKTN